MNVHAAYMPSIEEKLSLQVKAKMKTIYKNYYNQLMTLLEFDRVQHARVMLQ